MKPSSSSLSLQRLLLIFLSCRSRFHRAFNVYSQVPPQSRREVGAEWDGLVQAREHPEAAQEQQPLWLGKKHSKLRLLSASQQNFQERLDLAIQLFPQITENSIVHIRQLDATGAKHKFHCS